MRLINFFPYFGPNRRHEQPVVEMLMEFDEHDRCFLSDRFGNIENQVLELLQRNGLITDKNELPRITTSTDACERFAGLCVSMALYFQRKTDHQVEYCSVQKQPEDGRIIGLIEHEHADVGMSSVKLAWEIMTRKRQNAGEAFRQLQKFARARLLPPDTQAIIEAAQSRDIPWMKLERFPFKPEYFISLTGKKRSQPNGLIMLGHARYQRILDGTFCLDASEQLRLLRDDQRRMKRLLADAGTPIARTRGKRPGNRYQFVVANGKITAVVRSGSNGSGPMMITEPAHPDFNACALEIYRAAEAAVAVITFEASNLNGDFSKTGAQVRHVELAPVLSDIIPAGNQALRDTAECIVESLFPRGSPSRVPIIAATGTNGKTTTCRMINHVMIGAGKNPTLVCSDGGYVNNRLVKPGDGCSLTGHARMLSQKEIDIAVLEAHHNGLYQRGFAFHWCDVAICTNVTRDHIHPDYIPDIPRLAEIKRSLIERARHAAVLNADNEHSLGMLPHVNARKTCLISMESTAAELVANAPSASSQCVLENIDGESWIVIHDDGLQIPLMRVAEIPACFDGAARHNVSNALAAVAACYFTGIEPQQIATALQTFKMDFASNPGRMNFHDTGKFQVMMDYAHNRDGMQNLVDFIDSLNVSGRKIIMFGAPGDRLDEDIKDLARVVAGHFDHYVCRRNPDLRGRTENEVATLLADALLEAGIRRNRISRVSDPEESFRHTLEMAAPGDLLLIRPNAKEKYGLWEKIIEL